MNAIYDTASHFPTTRGARQQHAAEVTQHAVMNAAGWRYVPQDSFVGGQNQQICRCNDLACSHVSMHVVADSGCDSLSRSAMLWSNWQAAHRHTYLEIDVRLEA